MTDDDGIKIPAGPVTLREFREGDADDVYAIVGDDRVTQWLSFDSRDHAAASLMVKEIISRARQSPRNEYYLAIAETTSDRVLGFARLGLSGVKAAKLGYALGVEFQGKGLVTSATKALIDYGFQSLDLHRITAAVGPDNTASAAVLQRLGFHREGQLRDHVFTNGQWRDSILFSLLAIDPPTVRAVTAEQATPSTPSGGQQMR